MTDTSVLVGRRVLITEDEVILAMEIEQTMKQAGCKIVGMASSLEQALKFLATEVVDFAILDINLGGKEVFPLAAKLRTMKIPFIFLTGYSRRHLIPHEYGDSICLEKPVREALLLKTSVKLCKSN